MTIIKDMNKKICEKYCFRKRIKKENKQIKNIEKLGLVVFDMDGVLTDTYSSWRYVHDFFNTSNEKSVIEYLKGDFDDEEFIKRDARLWREKNKPITRDKLSYILDNIPIMNGAKNCINQLSKNNIKTAIVSAGLDILAERVAKTLNIDYYFSNGIKVDNNGFLKDEAIVKVKLIHKDENIEYLSKQLEISLDSIASVGNSCYDIPMFETSGLGIAFNPEDECVIKAADYVIFDKDLSKLIPILKKYF